MRRLAIPDAATMLALHPSEVRMLIDDGRLEAVRARGRWLISFDSVQRLDAAGANAREAAEPGPLEPELRRLEARVAELEQRLESVESLRPDAGKGGLRPALEPLFRTTE